ncbi:hypothetical protein J6590_051469 [Homalodisca vitripennis]|nr:hypothetical protein J6590_051469 [Homalodisca vitripennis]
MAARGNMGITFTLCDGWNHTPPSPLLHRCRHSLYFIINSIPHKHNFYGFSKCMCVTQLPKIHNCSLLHRVDVPNSGSAAPTPPNCSVEPSNKSVTITQPGSRPLFVAGVRDSQIMVQSELTRRHLASSWPMRAPGDTPAYYTCTSSVPSAEHSNISRYQPKKNVAIH